MSIVKGVTLQDVHFGHKESERMYRELQQVKRFLEEKEVHILNINGDYFDRKLSATEPSILYAVTFFNDLVDICTRKNIKMRVLLGTRSHDLNQYSTLFNHYAGKKGLDYRYIDTVQEENINGINVLYIPEEYPENSSEYYKAFKTNNYRIIHGHGTWDFASFESQIEESNKIGVHTAPVFMYEEWKNSIKDGFVIFGHIHKRQSYKNVYYSGSFTRWSYGDRSDKGFVYYEVDTDSNKWKFEYIDNKEAPAYDVISVKELFDGVDPNQIAVEDIQKALNEAISRTDNLRIDLGGLTEDKIKILRKSFEKNDKVKVEVKEKKTMLKEANEIAIYEKYGYILNRELPLDETVKKFVKEEYGVDMTIEKVRELLL
jgi:DNA repair exonuclease SbcCD nuclease subunit